MPADPIPTSTEPPRGLWIRRTMGAAMLATACAAVAILGLRTVSSFDIGYHLLYGQRTIDTRNPVDDDAELYAFVDVPDGAEMPPGAWVDDLGRHRFPNANWLSQVLFAVAYGLGGWAGLSVLGALLAGAIAAAAAVCMLRLRAGAFAASLGVLVIGIASVNRLSLRPELLAYAILAGQLAILLPVAVRGRLGGAGIAGFVGLQLLAVNVHSYWMLSLGAATALLVGQCVGRATDPGNPEPRRRIRIRLAIGLALATAACFANPWTWRLVALPVQTLRFLAEHKVSTVAYEDGGHAWAVIGEFFRPWDAAFAGRVSTFCFYGLLALAALGVVAAGLRRRIGLALLIAGSAAISLSMRRNVAPAAVLLVPAATACLRDAVRKFGRPLAPFGPTAVRAAALAAIAGGAGLLIAATVSDRLYLQERRVERFGLGPNRLQLPLHAAAWLNAHRPAGRIFCDYDAASNLAFLLDPPAKVPILTNTWAYPPATMRAILDLTRGRDRIGRRVDYVEAFHAARVQCVVLRISTFTAEPDEALPLPLGLALSADPLWRIVCIDGMYVVFVRDAGPNRLLVARHALDPETFDAAGYAERLRRLDPQPGQALYVGGRTLSLLGWNARALEVLAAAVDAQPGHALSWYEMGICHLRLSALSDRAAHQAEARRCLENALQLDPSLDRARAFLSHLPAVAGPPGGNR